MIKNEDTTALLQHFPHRLIMALEVLGAASPERIAAYMTANGHRIGAKRVRRYLEALPQVTKVA